jgi:hypothetical protein
MKTLSAALGWFGLQFALMFSTAYASPLDNGTEEQTGR